MPKNVGMYHLQSTIQNILLLCCSTIQVHTIQQFVRSSRVESSSYPPFQIFHKSSTMKGPSFFPAAIALIQLCVLFLIRTDSQNTSVNAFTINPIQKNSAATNRIPSSKLFAAITEKEASAAIDKVVQALRKDKAANEELGKLQKVNNVLGFGSPRKGVFAVRFNASFKKGGMGRSAVPLPFGIGQSDKAEGRGTMVGQVKATVDATSGKVLEASVFRDLGYGRSFNLKV